MPSGLVFIILAVLLRMTEGVGWAMFTTSMLSTLAQLFPTHVALMSVWKLYYSSYIFSKINAECMQKIIIRIRIMKNQITQDISCIKIQFLCESYL